VGSAAGSGAATETGTEAPTVAELVVIRAFVQRDETVSIEDPADHCLRRPLAQPMPGLPRSVRVA
jgi:hypothetical protein